MKDYDMELANKIFSALYDEDDLNELESKGVIAQKLGFECSTVAIIALEIDDHDGWIGVDDWIKQDCVTVLAYYTLQSDLGKYTGFDKAYWCKDSKFWKGYGLDNPFSDGASITHIMSEPQPPKAAS